MEAIESLSGIYFHLGRETNLIREGNGTPWRLILQQGKTTQSANVHIVNNFAVFFAVGYIT